MRQERLLEGADFGEKRHIRNSAWDRLSLRCLFDRYLGRDLELRKPLVALIVVLAGVDKKK